MDVASSLIGRDYIPGAFANIAASNRQQQRNDRRIDQLAIPLRIQFSPFHAEDLAADLESPAVMSAADCPSITPPIYWTTTREM